MVGDSVRIPLRAKDGSIRDYTVVDMADADWVNQWRWCLDSDGYAVRTEYAGQGRAVRLFRLHRELLGLIRGDGMDGDHIDRDRLNNRRSNLRAAPKGGNAQNRSNSAGTSSQYRGVGWHKTNGKWQARISIGGKLHHLGYSPDELEAAEIARAARLREMPYAID